MKRTSSNIDEKEMLKRLEGLIDSKDSRRRYSNSFLGFCARLLSIKPKEAAGFRSSLEQVLLEKHAAYVEKKADAAVTSKLGMLTARLHDLAVSANRVLLNMKPVKRAAFGSVPVLAIALALIIAVANPRVDIARAMEIMENDPQISSVIEAYNLKVQRIEMRDHLGYIFLDIDPDIDDVEVTIIVDLNRETVWKIVAREGAILSKDEITGYLDGKKAYWEEKKREFAAEAKRIGMTLEEYEAHIYEQKVAEFEAKAESMGMTPDEYKAYLAEKAISKVELYLKMDEGTFAAEAENMGMTPDEYKAYLTDEWEAEKSDFKK